MVNLYRMRMLNRKTIKIQWKIEKAVAGATKITTVLTGMPRGGKQQDQTGDGAIKIAELRDAYSDVIRELQEMRDEIRPLIDKIEDVDIRTAMILRYINGHKPEDIADAVIMADRTIYRYLKRGEAELCERFPDKIISGQLINCQ